MSPNLDWSNQVHHAPVYAVADVARYLQIPVPTLRTWLKGRTYPTKNGSKALPAIIQRPSDQHSQLSFINLIEAHVLRVIRQSHRIRLDKVREAMDYVSQQLVMEHPLARVEFQTDGVDLFVESFGNLINASRSGQLAMRDVLRHLLTRIDWNEEGIAERLFPMVQTLPDIEPLEKPLTIDPRVSFGRPVISGTGIPTDVIAELYDAGDSIDDLAEEYDCQSKLIHAAIWFESRNRAACFGRCSFGCQGVYFGIWKFDSGKDGGDFCGEFGADGAVCAGESGSVYCEGLQDGASEALAKSDATFEVAEITLLK